MICVWVIDRSTVVKKGGWVRETGYKATASVPNKVKRGLAL